MEGKPHIYARASTDRDQPKLFHPFFLNQSLYESPSLKLRGASNDLEAQAYAPIISSTSIVTDTTLPPVSTISMATLGKSAPI